MLFRGTICKYWEPYEAQICSVGRMQSFSVLTLVVHTLGFKGPIKHSYSHFLFHSTEGHNVRTVINIYYASEYILKLTSQFFVIIIKALACPCGIIYTAIWITVFTLYGVYLPLRPLGVATIKYIKAAYSCSSEGLRTGRLGFDSRQCKIFPFSTASRPALGPNHSMGTGGCFPVGKATGARRWPLISI
jgi:NADH:ubiquinone oxidoreductase subunit K